MHVLLGSMSSFIHLRVQKLASRLLQKAAFPIIAALASGVRPPSFAAPTSSTRGEVRVEIHS
jgi:hypothetical protein